MARLLLDMLPPELAAITTPEERAAEYLDYRQFFIAWETVERVMECQTLEAPQMSRDTRATWLEDYGVRALFWLSLVFLNGRVQGQVSSAREQILKILTMDWLVPESDIPGSTCPLTLNDICLLLVNALQPTVVRGSWRASDSCSSQNSYFAYTDFSSPRGLISPSAFCSFLLIRTRPHDQPPTIPFSLF